MHYADTCIFKFCFTCFTYAFRLHKFAKLLQLLLGFCGSSGNQIKVWYRGKYTLLQLKTDMYT